MRRKFSVSYGEMRRNRTRNGLSLKMSTSWILTQRNFEPRGICDIYDIKHTIWVCIKKWHPLKYMMVKYFTIKLLDDLARWPYLVFSHHDILYVYPALKLCWTIKIENVIEIDLLIFREAALQAAKNAPLFSGGKSGNYGRREKYPFVFDALEEARQSSSYISGVKVCIRIVCLNLNF